jgi:hypothetical protein
MADNIRPAIYDAKYEAVVVNRADDEPVETVTIAGKYCESGDILIKDARLPATAPGDVIAMPAAGAYALSMSSNYNMSLRPAVVVVKDGSAQLIQRGGLRRPARNRRVGGLMAGDAARVISFALEPELVGRSRPSIPSA